jgi:hypothetical protein
MRTFSIGAAALRDCQARLEARFALPRKSKQKYSD